MAAGVEWTCWERKSNGTATKIGIPVASIQDDGVIGTEFWVKEYVTLAWSEKQESALSVVYQFGGNLESHLV
jgi:hypothetical protein